MELTGSQPTVLWENKNMSNHFHTSIYFDGYLFGIDGVMGKKTSLRCLDFQTGDIMWEQPFDFGPIIAADNKLIVLSEKGRLHIVKISNQEYHEIASTQIFQEPDDTGVPRNKRNRCWAPPVLTNGYIYVRNSHGDLVCVDIR
jgi:outer membrane protein assembly factor BamB